MRQSYSRPCLTKIHQSDRNIVYTQYFLTALTDCEAETLLDCQNDLTPTVQFLFCGVGISDGSQLEGCSLSLLSCPAEMTNCHTEPSLQGTCDSFQGGGLAVECSITFDCTASCGGTPNFEVTCDNGSPIACHGVG